MSEAQAIHTLKDGNIEVPSSLGVQTEALDNCIPEFVTVGNHHTVILTPTDKTLIITYSFIGLVEIVAHTSGMTKEAIYEKCIQRSIVNLQKDGLLG